MHAHASFCYVWISLERNTYTAPHVIIISFIMAVPKFISADAMKGFVIEKDLSYSDVSNMLQEKNPDAKGIKEFPREVLGVFLLLIISESNQISVNMNFRKLGGIKGMTFKVFIIHGNNRFEKYHPSYSAVWITLLPL